MKLSRWVWITPLALAMALGSLMCKEDDRQARVIANDDDATGDELEELPLPQKFDVRTQFGIQSPDVLDHIRRVGRVIYRRG